MTASRHRPGCDADTATKDPFWMTYPWPRFRAQGPTATLRLSGWAKPAEPVGPVGQQTMVNFVEVQPVFVPGGRP